MTRQAKQMAESLTHATTRRGFLGRLARVAGGAAAGAAAILATGSALGAPKGTEMKICYYSCFGQDVFVLHEVPVDKKCPKKHGGCDLLWGGDS